MDDENLEDAWQELPEGLPEGMPWPPKKLDFSRFHPMDHRWWECWQRNRVDRIYGKTWTHAKYWWLYVRGVRD